MVYLLWINDTVLGGVYATRYLAELATLGTGHDSLAFRIDEHKVVTGR